MVENLLMYAGALPAGCATLIRMYFAQKEAVREANGDREAMETALAEWPDNFREGL